MRRVFSGALLMGYAAAQFDTQTAGFYYQYS